MYFFPKTLKTNLQRTNSVVLVCTSHIAMLPKEPLCLAFIQCMRERVLRRCYDTGARCQAEAWHKRHDCPSGARAEPFVW